MPVELFSERRGEVQLRGREGRGQMNHAGWSERDKTRRGSGPHPRTWG